MKFVCDSCHAQYMISDDKVGPNGVKVRCKKCKNVIVVKHAADAAEATMVMQNPLAAAGAPTPGAKEPFGGLGLDEIGQAFDSVLSEPGTEGEGEATSNAMAAASESAAGGADAGLDRESTRVVNLAELANLAAQSQGADVSEELKREAQKEASDDAGNGKANGHGSAVAVPQTDWYVAIDDEQKGPFTLDAVKKHWEEGKVTPDSLVWRNGYGDWKALSTLPDLVKVLTPVPARRKLPEPPPEAQAPAGATASGPQVPWQAPAAPPPAVPDPEEPDWKPSAASALASLVKEEMDALTKPTPKRTEEPVGVGEGTRPRARGLLDVPEEPLPKSTSALPDEGVQPPLAGPESPLGPARTLPEMSPRTRTPAPPTSAEMPAYSPSPAYAPRSPPPPSNAKWFAIAAVGVTGILGAVALAFLVLREPKVEAPPVAVKRVLEPVPAAAPPAPIPAPSPPAAPQAAPSPVPEPRAVAQAPARPAAAPPPPVAAPTERHMVSEKDDRRRGSKKGHRGDRQRVAAAEPAPPPERQVNNPPPAASDGDLLNGGGRSKVDDDFNRLLGGGGGNDSNPEPSAGRRAKKSSTYIPPAMGADVPDQLGKGDIMSVVAGHKDQIKRCVAEQRAKDPDASGEIVIHWQIDRTGRTSQVRCTTDEFKRTHMASCMSSQIKGWKFPPFSGRPMPIDFPFRF